ncbi:hypothetical protein DITRI_Ditri12bG0085400 [Diplodiscus trichospermus]
MWFKEVEAEVDNSWLVQGIDSRDSPVNSHYALINSIKELLSRNWSVKLPPDEAKDALDHDVQGVLVTQVSVDEATYASESGAVVFDVVEPDEIHASHLWNFGLQIADKPAFSPLYSQSLMFLVVKTYHILLYLECH